MAGPVFLGVDAGGTKTRAVLLDAEGRVLAEAVAGPGNLLAVGAAVAGESLRSVVEELRVKGLRMAGGELAGAHFGVAGVGRPGDEERVRRLVEGLGLPCEFGVSDDARVAFHSVAEPPGVVLICGTGSIAVAYGVDGREVRAGGHGYLLGDEGSGYWIGREALRAALRAEDGRGAATGLVEVVPAVLGYGSLRATVSAVYAGEVGRDRLAALARHVLEVEDPVVAGISAEAAAELALAVRAVVARLGADANALTLVLAGGVLRGNESLRRDLEREVSRSLPGMRFCAAEPVPAVGAAWLALRAAG